MTKTKLSFFFPYKELSGCPVLFLNIAHKIIELYGDDYEISLIDYRDGYMATHVTNSSRIQIIPFDDGKILSVDTDYLIMQAYLPEAIRPELVISNNTKVLFWMLNPWNYLPVVMPFNFFPHFTEEKVTLYSKILRCFYPITFNRAKGFISYMIEHNSTVFMNRSDLPFVEKTYSYDNLNPQFIPIASSDAHNHKCFKNSEYLNMCWVGRLCSFKIEILNYTMQRAYEYANKSKKKVVFHVIGTGELAHLLYDKESNYFKIKKLGSMAKEDLDQYLLDNIDINFAMGTSVIESAKLGIPSVKLDASNGEIPNTYRFTWFHNAEGYDIGHVIDESDCDGKGVEIKDLVGEFYDDNEELSNKAIAHYEKYFSLSMVTRMIVSHMPSITTTWGEIPAKFKKRGLVRSLYYRYKYGI